MNKRLCHLHFQSFKFEQVHQITNTFHRRRYIVKTLTNLNVPFTVICCRAPILLPVRGQVRMRRKGVTTLVFKTNATLCCVEQTTPVYNVNNSYDAADVIHII